MGIDFSIFGLKTDGIAGAKTRRQEDKLSEGKLDGVLRAYRRYHTVHAIDENKRVYITKSELEGLQ